MGRNRKIHDWTKRLVRHVNRVGIRATEPVFSTSRKGYYSAYFGVPGLGEVRVSDHPMGKSRSTADISISSPSSYLDLAKAFAFKHNQILGTDLTVIDQPPYIVGKGEGADLIRRIEEMRIRKEAARAALAADVSARIEWWEKQISASGIQGTPKEVKHQLKRRGVRYPGNGSRENDSGTE